jgi:hypothetical protein
MALVSITGMTNDVLMELPDVPAPLIEQRMQKVIQDFCERTNAWQETSSHTGVQGQEEYTLTKSDEGEIIKIMKVTVDGNEVAYGNYELVDGKLSFPGNFVPNTDNEIVATISLIPNTNQCPDWFLTHYKNHLINGCVSSLMKLPRRPWTDYGLARFFEKEFFKGVGLELNRQANAGANNSGGFMA